MGISRTSSPDLGASSEIGGILSSGIGEFWAEGLLGFQNPEVSSDLFALQLPYTESSNFQWSLNYHEGMEKPFHCKSVGSLMRTKPESNTEAEWFLFKTRTAKLSSSERRATPQKGEFGVLSGGLNWVRKHCVKRNCCKQKKNYGGTSGHMDSRIQRSLLLRKQDVIVKLLFWDKGQMTFETCRMFRFHFSWRGQAPPRSSILVSSASPSWTSLIVSIVWQNFFWWDATHVSTQPK